MYCHLRSLVHRYNLIALDSSLIKTVLRGTVGFSFMCTMSRSLIAVVRYKADEPRFQLSFSYGNGSIQERMFNFNRSKGEQIGVLLNRIQKNLESILNKKLKKKKKNASLENEQTTEKFLVTLANEMNLILPEYTLDSDAWKNGHILTVGENKYTVTVNAPTVQSLSLPKHIMAGFPVYPKAHVEFCTKEESHFEWLTTLTPEEASHDDCGMTTRWQNVGSGYHFVPKPSDVGRNLKVVCEPRDASKSGLKVETVSQKAISAGPGLFPFEERHLYTTEEAPENCFRVVSYNILADLYADSDHTRTVLFPYCPPYALEADYRKQLIMKEILGYNGDLICLQEVDSKLFRHDVEPILSAQGMEGHFLEKGGQVVEGLACFVRNKKFCVLESGGCILSEQLPTNPVLAKIYSKICENGKLKERVLARTTAFQVLVIESVEKPNSVIIVGNTHLYFHPDADHIRLLQAAMCLLILENKLQSCKEKWADKDISVILCGDFNSCPEFAVYQLMTTGNVPHTSADWNSAPEERILDFSVSHKMTNFQSACGTPPYTNYTTGFDGCLDYIFFQPSVLNLDFSVPLPTHEQVVQHIALPNVVFPSDHIALVATLSWKQ